ncbi:hypothetical protein M3Y94_00823900 [Aphelenchoides besseyi]|nr:hypothetical protein M3Y94_00823900 [Aphelenchoides besseyi]
MSTSSTDLVAEIVQHPIRHVYCAKCDEDVLVNERKRVGITAVFAVICSVSLLIATIWLIFSCWLKWHFLSVFRLCFLGFVGITCILFSCIHDLLFCLSDLWLCTWPLLTI